MKKVKLKKIPIWLWILILILLLQVFKLANRYDWFAIDKNNKRELTSEEKKEIIDSTNKILKEGKIKSKIND